MTKNNLEVIDISNNLAYNAENKETQMKVNNPVPLTQKRSIVEDIMRQHRENAVPIPEACKSHNIKIYTFYNWKKRIDQLAAKQTKVVRYKAPVIIRKMPVKQSVSTGASLELPAIPAPQRCAVIITDTADLHNVLRELL